MNKFLSYVMKQPEKCNFSFALGNGVWCLLGNEDILENVFF
jgi:hypothetical protein